MPQNRAADSDVSKPWSKKVTKRIQVAGFYPDEILLSLLRRLTTNFAPALKPSRQVLVAIDSFLHRSPNFLSKSRVNN